MSHVRLVLAVLLALIAGAWTTSWMATAIHDAGKWSADQMADAVPLYLTARTVDRGGDPTQAAALAETYRAEGMRVGVATFSTLYPASTPALLAPLVRSPWRQFGFDWRGVLLWSAVVAGAAGGASGAGRRWWLGAAVGAFAATVGFPTSLECARLGQINQLLAAGAGLAQAAVAVGVPGVGAAILVLAGGLKLVPVLAGWPFLTGRRWRAVAAAFGTGVGVLVLTHLVVPLDVAMTGVFSTLRYQSTASANVVADLPRGSPSWAYELVFARHHPLAVLTLALAGIVGWRARPQALVGGIALVFAWLGADAAAQHELYLPLSLASMAWALVWPVSPDAPKWAAVTTLLLVAALAWMPGAHWSRPYAAVVVGEAIWVAVTIRAVWEARPFGRMDLAVLALAFVTAGALMLFEPRPMSYP